MTKINVKPSLFTISALVSSYIINILRSYLSFPFDIVLGISLLVLSFVAVRLVDGVIADLLFSILLVGGVLLIVTSNLTRRQVVEVKELGGIKVFEVLDEEFIDIDWRALAMYVIPLVGLSIGSIIL